MSQQEQTPNQPAMFQQLQQQIGVTQFQVIRCEQQIAALRAELEFHKQGRAPRMPIEFTSQFGEDLVAWNLFNRKTDGFFIEAGAFDGHRYSVTYPFEAVGWTGLLVEPLKDKADECARRRSHSRVVNAALSSRGAPAAATFTRVNDQYGGMLSYLKTTDKHRADTSWATRSTTEVPVTTLNDLLANHTGPIDLAVIDVEGGEIDVLDGFDLSRFRPRLMFIEENTLGRDPTLGNYMRRHPYVFAGRVAMNDVYIRNDEAEIIERMKWLSMG